LRHLQIGRDGRDVAGGDRFGRQLHHRRETIQLQLGMIGAAVDRPFLQDLGDDLPDPLAAHGFLARNLLVACAFPQPGEDPLPPRHLAERAQMPAQRRCLLNHPNSFRERRRFKVKHNRI
jgi:hypothetical protein